MATYVPNATQTTEPVESRTVESAALEFRTLKTSVNSRVAVNNALDLRTTALEQLALNGSTPGTVVVTKFVATASQTVFTLSVTPLTVATIDVHINGVYQNRDSFSLAANVVTLNEGVIAGAEVEIKVSIALQLGVTDASFVEYLPAGTGAVATTVQGKLRESVSVKDFGAVGDGVTDDTAAIQAALDSVGNIVFPGGVYYVTKASLEALPLFGLAPPSGTTVYFNGNASIRLQSNVDIRHIFVVMGVTNVTFLYPQIDGNSSMCNGIGINGASDVCVIGGTIKNIKAAAQVFDETTYLGGGKAITAQYGCENVRVTSTHFHNCFIAIDFVGATTNKSAALIAGNITAENCNIIIGCVGTDASGIAAAPENFNTAIASISGVSFKNCGSSTGVDDRVNFSFTWQATASGNAFPWMVPARTGTSFSSQDWLMSAYDAAAEEWNPASAYNTSSKVKYTNTGKDSALFCFDHCSGLSVSNVRGYNDTVYGTIGALFRGLGKNIAISDVQVTCAVDHIYRHGPTPCLSVTTHNFERGHDIHIRDVANLGTTAYVMESDGPRALADSTLSNPFVPYYTTIAGIQIKESGNIALVGTTIGTVIAAENQAFLEIYNAENGGRIRGNPVDINGLTIADSYSAFNKVDNYEEFSYTEAHTGITGWVTPPILSLKATRVGRLVTLTWNDISGTSNSTTIVISSLSTRLRPSINVHGFARCRDNSGTPSTGMLYVTTAGLVIFYPNPAAGTWTASGVKTIWSGSFSYSID